MRSKAHEPIPITPAEIQFEESSIYSPRYGDIYASRDGAVQESEHVFLAGNRLPERFDGRERFTIGEIGFGTGLNFLLTLREWKKHGVGRLSYLAYELHPLRVEDLRRALELQLGECPEIQELVERYPRAIEGFHVIHFDSSRVTLLLAIGDAAEKLAETRAENVDAWFLDGFSPERNPELWSRSVLEQVSRLSNRGTTLGTYTVKGELRGVLSEFGWSVERVPGVGKKRHVLRGEFSAGVAASAGDSLPKNVAVVGGGIAGATAAYAFARRGMCVTLFEKADGLCRGASGNERAIAFPYLSGARDERHRFYVTAFQYLERVIRDVGYEPDRIGTIRLPKWGRRADRPEKIRAFGFPEDFVYECEDLSDVAGISLPTEGLFFPCGMTLSLLEFSHALTKDVELRFTTDAFDADDYEAIVIATGYAPETLPGELAALLTPVAGEIGAIASSNLTRPLRTVLCGDGYMLPDRGRGHLVGATYHRGVEHVDTDGTERIRTIAQGFFPEESFPGPIPIRTGIRATTKNRLPILAHKGRYLYSLGHGSRAAVSAPLAGEALAALISNEPTPLENSLRDSVLL